MRVVYPRGSESAAGILRRRLSLLEKKISKNKFQTNPIYILDTTTYVVRLHYLDLSSFLFFNSFVHQQTMPQQFSRQNHVYNLPTGYRFAMASVVDDAKKKGQEAK